MNQTPSDHDDEMERRFRGGLSDSGAPSEGVRRAILEHARRMAAEHANLQPLRRIQRARFARRTVFGTLAAAVFAGLLVVPILLKPPVREESALSPKSAAAPSRQIDAPPAAVPEQSDRAESAALAPRKFTADVVKPKFVEPAPARDFASQANTAVSADAVQPALSAPAAPGMQASAGPAPVIASAGRNSGRTSNSPAMRPEDLQRAAITGDLAAVNTLLNGSLDVDAQDPSGRTALMLAIVNGRTQIVDVLLAHGADANSVDARGGRPLQLARAQGNQEIIALLLRAGAH